MKELENLERADQAWRDAKAAIDVQAEQYKQELLAGNEFAQIAAARFEAAQRARGQGASMRAIATALHTKATSTAYEVLAGVAPVRRTVAAVTAPEFATTDDPGVFIVTPPALALREFAANMYECGNQASARYMLDEEGERITPLDPHMDEDGKTNPVLKYVQQTKGYMRRAYEWATENVEGFDA